MTPLTKQQRALTRAKKLYGSNLVMVKALGCARTSYYQWFRLSAVPAHWARAIEINSNGKIKMLDLIAEPIPADEILLRAAKHEQHALLLRGLAMRAHRDPVTKLPAFEV